MDKRRLKILLEQEGKIKMQDLSLPLKIAATMGLINFVFFCFYILIFLFLIIASAFA
jgi:hypothetical protein